MTSPSVSPNAAPSLRWGILGAARINKAGIVDPARLAGQRLGALAARDRERAEAFAPFHGGESALDSYAAVIDSAEVNALYNPLPNGLPAPRAIKAIASRKHARS